MKVQKLGSNLSSTEKIACGICQKEITHYYSYNYKGNRGKCLECGADFPLD